MRKENKGFRATNGRFLQSALESEPHQKYLRSRILELMRDRPYTTRDVLQMLNLTVKYFKEFLCTDLHFKNEVAILDRRNYDHQLYFGTPFVARGRKNYDFGADDVHTAVDEHYPDKSLLDE